MKGNKSTESVVIAANRYEELRFCDFSERGNLNNARLNKGSWSIDSFATTKNLRIFERLIVLFPFPNYNLFVYTIWYVEMHTTSCQTFPPSFFIDSKPSKYWESEGWNSAITMGVRQPIYLLDRSFVVDGP